MPLPTNRTTANTDAEHVADHNAVHAQHNTLEAGVVPADGSVTTAKLAAGAVTAAKVAADVATQAELDDHVNDTTAAHAATAVAFTPAGTIAATTVQAAIEEVATEAPTGADYLVGTTQAGLSAEIVVGTTPGGELGGTWAAPTVDATHSGSTHASKVDKATLDANSVLYAVTDDTPAALAVAASRIVGRKATGDVVALTGAEALAITGGITQADLDAAGLVTEVVKTANHTLVLSDGGKAIAMDVATANNLTVPPNSSVAFPVGTVIEARQLGAGQTTIVAGSGVNLRSAGGRLKLGAQYSVASIAKRATDEWIVAGDLVV